MSNLGNKPGKQSTATVSRQGHRKAMPMSATEVIEHKTRSKVKLKLPKTKKVLNKVAKTVKKTKRGK